MAKTILMFSITVFANSAFSELNISTATPVEIFQAALAQNSIQATDVQASQVYQFVLPPEQGNYFVKIAGRWGLSTEFFNFYRLSYVQNGKMHTCVGSIARPNVTGSPGIQIDIDQCDVDFFERGPTELPYSLGAHLK